MCTWEDAVYYVSIKLNTYSNIVKRTWIIDLILRFSTSGFEKHMRNCQILVVRWRTCTYHMGEITGNTLIYIQKWLIARNWTEWMKGICHTWSRGRHFSPSLPGDRYLNLGSPKKRSPGRNLGEHRLVRRSGATSRGTALILLSLCKWCVLSTIFDALSLLFKSSSFLKYYAFFRATVVST